MSDRDTYSIIMESSLLPTEHEPAADYKGVGTKKLDRDSTIDDICDFVVEYINSDMLVNYFSFLGSPALIYCLLQGLLSDRHLVIAGK